MTDFQVALTAFLTADPAHPLRTIIVSFLVGALALAIFLLIYRRKGWGITRLLVIGFAIMLFVIGALNFVV